MTICAVNCFVIATGYLYLGKKVKVSRAVELWLQMVFLSALVLVVALACGLCEEMGNGELVTGNG